MRRFIVLTAVLSLVLAAVAKAVPTVAEVTHSEFQAVDASGEHTYNATDKVVLEGIFAAQSCGYVRPNT